MSTLWPVLTVSLKVALFTTFLVMSASLVLGLFISQARFKTAKKALEFLVYVPMAMPPVALGYGLLVLCGPRSSLGLWLEQSFNIRIAFTFFGAVLASFMVSLGIGLRAVRLALEQIDEHHGHIAELLGASKAQVFFHITLPLCRSAIIGGAALVFLRSLGEFGATMVLAGNTLGSTRTIALAIWTDMQTPGREDQARVLVFIAASISLLALVASELLLRTPKR